MTDQYLQDIERVVQQAGIDGTLTKTAIDQYHAIIEANAKLVKENDAQAKLIFDKNEKLSKLEVDLGIANGLVGVAAASEVAMIERESKMTTLELTAKHEAVRVADHKDMFDKVFRNIETRRNVFTPQPASAGVDQYGTALPTGYVEEHEQTEKKG
jgi:hypothetical protein